jgi:hypothetical protein
MKYKLLGIWILWACENTSLLGKEAVKFLKCQFFSFKIWEAKPIDDLVCAGYSLHCCLFPNEHEFL